ncbi:DNA-directed RNA polymerase, phage-type [Lasallia pustulata]|uniref:DNA-directed RNA polymerase n=1 Tax=Lasallia pustulata TaxID=136370 RepID=A0A1W5D8M1_9LECA|nr:DNA-directed RNA polymerase, phage-type [Lasallia pustulata]
MLSRTSRIKLRRDPHQKLKACIEQLQLPWLCPALFRVPQQPRKASTIAQNTSASGGRLVRSSGRRHITVKKLSPHRGFAFAAAEAHDIPKDDYVPFEGQQNPSEASANSQSQWYRAHNLSSLKHFDPLSPLIINDVFASNQLRFRQSKGIGGQLIEIRQTFHACLQVGRLERAAAMLQRLSQLYDKQNPELLSANNDYLRSMVEKVVRTKDQPTLKQLQKWFEVNIRAAGITPDATTYALLIKAAFQEANALKTDRTIRRYLDLARKDGVHNEAITLPILSDQEFGKVTQIAPMEFKSDSEDILDTQGEKSEGLTADPSADDSLPTVLPVELKGLGLDALRKSLKLFSATESLPYPDVPGTQEEKDQAYAALRQQRLEEDTLNSAVDRWREENVQLKKLGLNTALEQQSVGSLMWNWHEALVPVIREEIRQSNEVDSLETKNLPEKERERLAYGPFLQVLPPEKLSAITILTCVSALSTAGIEKGVKIARLVMCVGNAVQDECLAEAIKAQPLPKTSKGALPDDQRRKFAAIMKKRQTSESRIRLSRYFKAFNEYEERQLWNPAILAKVGAILFSQLMRVAKIRVKHQEPASDTILYHDQPVFFHVHRYSAGKRVGVVRLNTAMSRILSAEPVGPALAKHLPMVSEPAAWQGTKKGGFLYHNVQVMRATSDREQGRQYTRVAAERGDLEQVFAGLDILGKTPWIINRSVFNVMLEAWNSGEAVANLSPLNPEVNYPPEPEQSESQYRHREWARQMRKLENERAATHSQRCFQNFQMEIARAYLKEKFYFPHSIDFRGRAYPIPPYLNHMGADNCRGLLMFAKGKELGASGLAWLKVHLANVSGFDKSSLAERQDFTADHLPDIYDSAINPLKGNKWWLEAEDPWQCLAACIELRNALELPDPTRYVSHLPIHQDGTCNGLQHYAALGGDIAGAKQVNLEPGDRPSDIYTAVAEMVKAELVVEAAQGNELAKVLESKLTRKVVKPTVMTNVYGVTFSGATAQVRSALEEGSPDFPNTATVNLSTASSYIARKIFKALSAMFNGAHDIQYWLGTCAARISDAVTPEQMDRIEDETLVKDTSTTPQGLKLKATNRLRVEDEHLVFKSSVIWTTPLKMPVVQPYRKATSRKIKTNLQFISIMQRSSSDPVSKRKQLQGFPPNFIHSLDATHMLLCALKCDEMGLSFAAVHDSFWTHAADLDVMNNILRDAFIRMHSEDIIGRLAAEFSARYKGCMYLASVPARSTVGQKIQALRPSLSKDLKGSKKSPKVAELLIERRRLCLLASENPVERAEGEAMITPAKLFAEMADEKDLTPLEDLKQAGVNSMPSKRVAKLQANEQLEVGDIYNIDTMEPFLGGGAALSPDTIDLDAEQADIEEESEDMEDEPENIEEHSFVEKRLEDTVEDSDAIEETSEAKNLRQQEIRKRKAPGKNIWLWLPLTFPPVPKKGDFDVSRLKNSQYFFS